MRLTDSKRSYRKLLGSDSQSSQSPPAKMGYRVVLHTQCNTRTDYLLVGSVEWLNTVHHYKTRHLFNCRYTQNHTLLSQQSKYSCRYVWCIVINELETRPTDSTLG